MTTARDPASTGRLLRRLTTLSDLARLRLLRLLEAEELSVAGKTYLSYDSTYYKPFSSDGETIYMVVEDPQRSA